MKSVFYSFLSVILIALTIFGCDADDEKYLPEGKGRPGELVVVVDTAFQNSTTGFQNSTTGCSKFYNWIF